MFIWSEQLETKIDVVDAQNQKLFILLNKLVLSLKQGNTSDEVLQDALKMLMHHATNYFNAEELLMLECKVDRRHLEMHRRLHQSFRYDVGKMSEMSGYEDNEEEKIERLVRFIASWLIYHILGTDMIMSVQMENIKKGMTPREAYETALGKKIDYPTVIRLFNAVLDLWIDSKNRCKQLEDRLTLMGKRIDSLEMERELHELKLQQTLDGINADKWSGLSIESFQTFE